METEKEYLKFLWKCAVSCLECVRAYPKDNIQKVHNIYDYVDELSVEIIARCLALEFEIEEEKQIAIRIKEIILNSCYEWLNEAKKEPDKAIMDFFNIADQFIENKRTRQKRRKRNWVKKYFPM